MKNKSLLTSIMVKYGDTQKTLAQAMGLSLSRFNAKINERAGASFTQYEMNFIKERYKLSCEEAATVFFGE